MTDEQFTPIVGQVSLDPYCSSKPRLLGVLDTNALLSSIDNDCRLPGRRSRLLQMTDGGTVALYAADHVYGETYRRLPRIALSSPIPIDALRRRFEQEYLPALRFVTVSTADVADPQVLAITDPDDVPTGQLAKLIPPCVVFSDDRHLRRPGFAPADWHAAARAAVAMADGVEKQEATAMLVVGAGFGTANLIKFVAAKLGAPAWLVFLGLVGVGAAALWRPERRQVAAKYAGPVAEALFQMVEQALIEERLGREGLRQVIVPALAEPSLKQQIAIVLARQTEPLLAKEVQALMQSSFSDEMVPTITEVRNVLSDNTEFFQAERHRWQFGRQAAPWHH